MNIRGQGRLFFGDVIFYLFGDLQLTLVTDGKNLNAQGGFAVELREAVTLDKFITDRGNILEQQAGTVRIGAHYDILEIPADIGLALGAHEDVARLGTDGTRRQIQ